MPLQRFWNKFIIKTIIMYWLRLMGIIIGSIHQAMIVLDTKMIQIWEGIFHQETFHLFVSSWNLMVISWGKVWSTYQPATSPISITSWRQTWSTGLTATNIKFQTWPSTNSENSWCSSTSQAQIRSSTTSMKLKDSTWKPKVTIQHFISNIELMIMHILEMND